VVVTDAHGKLEYTNQAARRVLARCQEHPGLGLCVKTAMELNLADLRNEGTRATRTMRLPPRSLDHQPYMTLRSARLLPENGATATFLYQPGEDPNFQHLAELLTKQEIRVLELVAQGLENKEIAECLTVSVDTVKSHLKRIFCKMQVTSRSQLLSRLFYGPSRTSAPST
jgi:DNA-binding CsgD family transcriptional regulator